jgi:hypothetical protein
LTRSDRPAQPRLTRPDCSPSQSLLVSLIHHSSPFHPSRRRPFDYRTEEQFDFSIAVDNDNGSSSGAEKAEGEGAVPWYEQEVLKSLNLGNNELEAVEEEMGGFEELEFLDVRSLESLERKDSRS